MERLVRALSVALSDRSRGPFSASDRHFRNGGYFPPRPGRKKVRYSGYDFVFRILDPDASSARSFSAETVEKNPARCETGQDHWEKGDSVVIHSAISNSAIQIQFPTDLETAEGTRCRPHSGRFRTLWEARNPENPPGTSKNTGPGMDPLRTTFQKSEIRTSCGLALWAKCKSSPLRDDFLPSENTPNRELNPQA